MIRLFRVSMPASIVMLVVSETVLLAACYYFSAFLALDALVDPRFYFRYENGWVQLVFVVASVQLGLYFMDLYEDPFPRSRTMLVQQLCLLLGVAFLLQAIIGYGKWELLQLPQWTMVYGSAAALVAIPAWRIVFLVLVKKAIPDKPLLFVGTSPVIQEIVARVQQRPEIGYSAVGYLGEPMPGSPIPHLGSWADLEQVAVQSRPYGIVFEEYDGRVPLAKLLELKVTGVQIEQAAELYEEVLGRVATQSLRPAQLVFSDFGPRPWTLRLQAAYSYLLGFAGLIVFSPLIAVSAVLVKLSSPGPVLYRQKRVGQRGAHFFLYKFRSMYADAEAHTGPVWATHNDPRVTPVGRWLRKLRLDELPQFFNVIRGEMALVGPRPERPEFCAVLAEKIPYYHQRHLVKPGITGWAQINHKYTDTIEDAVTKLEYDLYYVKHLAPALDAFILFHTVKVMLLSRGAR